jgi:nucleotide-binding universal stress UspA family protein
MTLPKTIVVPLDRSELSQRAVTVATPLAKKLGAGLLLVTVPWDQDVVSAQAYLDAIAGLAVDVPAETVVVHDRPAPEAIELIASQAPDRIVCMSTHGRGRFRWAVTGSVAEEVIGGSKRPLLLVGPHAVGAWSDPPGQVVFCADGSPAANALVDAACDWADALGAELTIAHVAHPLDVEGALRPEEVFTPIEKIAHDRGITVHTRLERGSYVAGALLDVASEPPATMMVMATRARTGFARVALGSVTMGVLNSAHCPVLVASPQFAEPTG